MVEFVWCPEIDLVAAPPIPLLLGCGFSFRSPVYA
jgi:hypothetical protein